jgi:hypothetical protein
MAASVLEHRAAENSLSLPLTSASAMSNPQLSPSRSDTENGHRYQSPNCRLRLNGQGRPVAIRRVVALQQPGSAAVTRYQAVTPRGVVGLSHSSLSAWVSKRSHPVN